MFHSARHEAWRCHWRSSPGQRIDEHPRRCNAANYRATRVMVWAASIACLPAIEDALSISPSSMRKRAQLELVIQTVGKFGAPAHTRATPVAAAVRAAATREAKRIGPKTLSHQVGPALLAAHHMGPHVRNRLHQRRHISHPDPLQIA